MTGSALFDFLITLVVLALIAALFFAVIDKVSPDATFTKIARIAVGGVLLIMALLAIKAVLFGGGPAIALGGGGLIMFAIGAIVILVVLYLINLALDYFGAAAGIGSFTAAIKYVIAACALIALLILAGNALYGGRYASAGALMSLPTPRIMQER